MLSGLESLYVDALAARSGNTLYRQTWLVCDVLVVRWWALLNNQGNGVAFVTSSDDKPLTKAQREFLYGYYSDRGLWKQAEQYLEE